MRKLPKRVEKTKPEHKTVLGPDRAAGSNSTPAQEKPPVVEPIAPARYKIQFTARAELHDKLERLRALMRSSVPDGDLATIIEEAVTEKLERLESKRFAKTKAPRKAVEETDTSPSSRYIPAAVRRAVCERDQHQCTYVGETGHRCTERDRLEFHHHMPYGHGGDRRADNIALMCRTHNAYLAERDYGKEAMERYKKYGRSSSRVYEPSTVEA
jgi:5-methylcytosine-specific restriction endonuclease McrA